MIKKHLFFILTIVSFSSCLEVQSTQRNNQNNEQIILENQTFRYSDEQLNNWLKLGLNQEEVIERLGIPENKGEDTYWGALGTFVQRWEYPSLGIELEMESNQEGGKKIILMITLSEPNDYLTTKEVGIGATRIEVENAYKAYIDNDFSSDSQLVVGSIYGGIIFSFEANKVSSIFIGAAAE